MTEIQEKHSRNYANHLLEILPNGKKSISESTGIDTPRQKSIRALEIFRVQKLILNATS